MASPLHCDGRPWPRATEEDGVAVRRERARHEATYADLRRSGRAKLVILGCEVGGRWDPEVIALLRGLAMSRCRDAPLLLQRSALLAWQRRWMNLVSVAAQTALAETLVTPGSSHLTEIDGYSPDLADVLHAARTELQPTASRLPLRG